MPKVLIVSKLFFPQPSVGAVRMTQWCRYLPESGWIPTVICLRQKAVATPEMVAQQVHPAVRVHYINEKFRSKVSDPTTATVRARRRVVRSVFGTSFASLFVPDFAQFEWKPHRKRIRAIAEEVKPDVILTTSSPHSVHELGMWLSREMNVPWVADFRDPYLSDARYRPRGLGRLLSWRHRAFERSIYDRAALVIHAIPSHQRYAAERYPAARERMALILNGAPSELLDGSVRAARNQNGTRSIRIVGHYEEAEAQLAAQAIRLLADRGEKVELRIIGTIPENADTLQALLGDQVILAGRKTHADALAEIAGADVLLSTLSVRRSQSQGLSSKLFEFLASGRPIIQINPTQPDRELTEGIESVTTLVTPSATDVANAISRALVTPPRLLQLQKDIAARYRRDEQARDLGRRLDVVVAQPHGVR